MTAANDTVRVTVYEANDDRTDLDAPRGVTLRDLLLEHDLSPYAAVTERRNCGGRGLCATCGVRFPSDHAPAPTHWHDRLADRFGYPRLSCQVTVEEPMVVRIPEKVVWGGRESGV